jgi:hypothetical protein
VCLSGLDGATEQIGDGTRRGAGLLTKRKSEMTREEALQYVSFQMNDAHDRRHAKPGDVSPNDRLVGFRLDLEIVFVAVRSHIPGFRLADQFAKDLARDYLTEIGWFGEESLEADYIL